MTDDCLLKRIKFQENEKMAPPASCLKIAVNILLMKFFLRIAVTLYDITNGVWPIKNIKLIKREVRVSTKSYVASDQQV